MNPEYLLLIGRILYGGYFVMSGFNHFMKGQSMIGYAKSKGVGSPAAAVYGSGLLLLAGGLSVLLGYQILWGVAALVLFLLPVSFIMHAFWKEEGQAKMGDQINFMKNMALLGAALMFLSIPTPWMWSI